MQDSVKTTSFSYKTNAITLVDGMNEDLKQLCLQNKGKYVYIPNDGKVKTFSNENKKGE